VDSRDASGRAALYRYRFGDAVFDESRFELEVAGAVVELELKPLQVLGQLLAHAGEVVSREELLEEIWTGRVTVEHVLTNAVAKLRKALGAADGERILTVPRIGYRLTGPVEKAAVGARLASRLDLKIGAPVTGREHFVLERQLSASAGAEVWVARHAPIWVSSNTARRSSNRLSTRCREYGQTWSPCLGQPVRRRRAHPIISPLLLPPWGVTPPPRRCSRRR
jgi:DNA-binding winged helix-turn-helix (wHTH) protein